MAEQKPLQDRYQEIRNLVSNHTTTQMAILRLMDFARDFCNNENQDEIIDDCCVLLTRHSTCTEGKKDIDELCLIGKSILSLVREIINQFKSENEK